MSRLRTIVLLAASAVAPALAWAQEDAPFVTQLRLPARGIAIDVVAWRGAEGIAVTRADLDRLSLVLPEGGGDRIALGAIAGLEAEEDVGAAAIVLRCVTPCLRTQVLAAPENTAARIDRARGAYLNYDFDAQWVQHQATSIAGVFHGAAFGEWGLLESSWFAASGDGPHGARLETRWMYDVPERRLRLRIGDSVALAADGAPVRFAGIQIGRDFGLAPNEITYPVAALGGDADTASMVELFVDGALQARERVEAGPFVFDAAPLVTGGGVAQLVITDLAGRQHIVTRPFFVSTALLRPGLSDWSLAAGAERRRFGRSSADYGRGFASARYRRGLSRSLTLETGLDLADDATAARAGFAFAHATIGQVSAAYARSADGGGSSFAWLNGRDAWSVGVQAEQRDARFQPLGRDDGLRRSVAGHVSVELGVFGAASLTAATIAFANEDARTAMLSLSPPVGEGAFSVRLLYTDHDESELSFGLSYALALRGDVSAGFGYDAGERRGVYRASLQHAADDDGDLGWRLRAAGGRRRQVEAGVTRRGRYGDSMAQAARSNGVLGARLGHSGSIGVIEGRTFAAAPIRGAFALVEVGAADVRVLRDRFGAGRTARDGHRLLTDLRPYESNLISINADDLPFDRTPTSGETSVMPAYGAGVVVRFTEETERLIETRALIGHGPAPRGALLVRRRDGARFPVGTDGRVVLRGARHDDVVELDLDRTCVAAADERSARAGLDLRCGVAA